MQDLGSYLGSKNKDLLKSLVSASGFTTKVKSKDRFLETSNPNELNDIVNDDYVIDGVLYSNDNRVVTKPLSPFDPNASDELLDDSVNGLVCQSAHNKADIVVTGNELVTNGTFDSDTSGWNQIVTGVSHDTSIQPAIKSVNPYGTTTLTGFSQNMNLVIGETYLLNFDILQSNTRLQVEGTTFPVGALGNKTVLFEATSTSVSFLHNRVGYPVSIIVDNISVKLADSIYQATRDTSEMYDFDNTQGSPTITQGDVVYIKDNSAVDGTVGHFYKLLLSGTYNLNLNDYSYNGINWLDLGTASNMDLRNPYFQVLDDVTTHDILAMTSTGYKSYRGIKHYLDQEVIDGGFDMVANDRGWTKISNNTYLDEDNEKVFIVCMLGSNLNAKMYHFDFNPFGSYQNSSNQFWWNDSTPSTSVYETFNKAVNTTSGRPDGKFYGKFYTEAENGLLGLGYSYCFNAIDLEIDKNILKDYVQGGTSSSKLTVDTLTDVSKTTWDLTKKAIEVYQVLYSNDGGTTWELETFTADYINNQVTLGTARTDVRISYTSANKPTETVPKEVLKVLDKVFASNSHSIYKDNSIANVISGGVANGNGSNSYESKVLENTLLDENNTITTTPKHTPIELDNSDSKAGKWFYALSVKDNQYYIDIYFQEVVYNGVDGFTDNGQFDDLSKCLSIPTGVYRK